MTTMSLIYFFFVVQLLMFNWLFAIQGGKIRAKLVEELSGVPGVVIEEGTAGEAGKSAAQDGMRK